MCGGNEANVSESFGSTRRARCGRGSSLTLGKMREREMLLVVFLEKDGMYVEALHRIAIGRVWQLIS
jgi:hypothetical protein